MAMSDRFIKHSFYQFANSMPSDFTNVFGEENFTNGFHQGASGMDNHQGHSKNDFERNMSNWCIEDCGEVHSMMNSYKTNSYQNAIMIKCLMKKIKSRFAYIMQTTTKSAVFRFPASKAVKLMEEVNDNHLKWFNEGTSIFFVCLHHCRQNIDGGLDKVKFKSCYYFKAEKSVKGYPLGMHSASMNKIWKNHLRTYSSGCCLFTPFTFPYQCILYAKHFYVFNSYTNI